MTGARPSFIAYAVSTGEGVLTASAPMGETGKYIGPLPQNRYIVDAPVAHENVNWDSPQNRPIDVETYERLYGNVAAHLSERELFVVRAYAGADRAYARKVIVICERASQALFISQLLVRPTTDELRTSAARTSRCSRRPTTPPPRRSTASTATRPSCSTSTPRPSSWRAPATPARSRRASSPR